MASKSLTATFESLPKIAKVLILIFVGVIVSGVYRIVRYLETKNTKTLVIAIIALATGGFFGVLAIIDLITLIFKGGYTVLVD